MKTDSPTSSTNDKIIFGNSNRALSLDSEDKALEIVKDGLLVISEQDYCPFLSWPGSDKSPGFYMMYESTPKVDFELVYVGVTLRGIFERMKEHDKMLSRSIKDKNKLYFKYVTTNIATVSKHIEVFLIRQYRPEWNGLGYGKKICPRRFEVA